MLLAAGADPTHVAPGNEIALTPLEYPSGFAKPRARFRPLADDRKVLRERYLEATRQLAQLLLNHGASPSVIDSSGTSPLAYAVDNNATDIARLYLDHGITADDRDWLHSQLLEHAIVRKPGRPVGKDLLPQATYAASVRGFLRPFRV